MKRILFYISMVLFLSCNQNKTTTKNVSVHIDEEGIYFVEDSIEKINEQADDSIISEENKEDEDCIFDQTTQTDDFLKGIKEFEGYTWNKETKTASIRLSENEALEIYRGGCAHFGLSISFKLIGENVSYPKDKQVVFGKLLWAAKLIKEFDYELIEKDILNENFEIYNGHNNTSLELLSETNNSLYIWISDHSEYSEIAIIFNMY
jgi:hypothetical protein